MNNQNGKKQKAIKETLSKSKVNFTDIHVMRENFAKYFGHTSYEAMKKEEKRLEERRQQWHQ